MDELGFSDLLKQYVEFVNVTDVDRAQFEIVDVEADEPSREREYQDVLKGRAARSSARMVKVIAESPMHPEGFDSVHTEMKKSKTVSNFMNMIFTHHKKPEFNHLAFFNYCDKHIPAGDVLAGFKKTDMAIHIQKRLGHELWRHLMLSRGAKDYATLFNHAFSVTQQELEAGSIEGMSSDAQSFSAASMNEIVLAGKNKKKGTKVINSLVCHPSNEEVENDSENCFNKLGILITEEMIRVVFQTQLIAR